MDIQAILTAMLVDFPALTTLLATLLFGEEAVIILGFLSGLGLLSITTLFIFGILGAFLSDLLWFVLGKTWFKEREGKSSMHVHYHNFMRYVDKFTHNHFLALLFTRFFYFFRLFAILHLSRRGMPWTKFLLYEIPIIIIWLVFFMALGWFFGKSAIAYLDVFADVQIVVFSIIGISAIFFLVKSLIRRKIETKV